MKKTIIYGFLASSFIIFSCKEGPEGPVGPAGPQGTNGKDGAQGVQGTPGQDGKDAKTSVNSTGWIKLDFTGGQATLNNSTYNSKIIRTYVSLRLKSNNQPLFTKDIIDNGLILSYIKYNTLEYDSSLGNYILVTNIQTGTPSTAARNYFKIEGRTTDKETDFSSIFLYLGESIRENYWNPSVSIETPVYTAYENGYPVSFSSTAPELVNQSLSFYRELIAKHQPEVRLVTIKGEVGARMKNIDYSDYEQVRQAFNLKD
ncbi:hypothetical protein GVN16_14525 [Emticicia sp. CRIBPO]|uniref:collagen-like protein n=1 Tax=Emticicia sp. CRIBPO TaxID=2683258 RepID=UPI00141346AF|nr:collagen-like protein [Emticicia sp. CRIBPO]NBA86984.1 hypothetical protein [Emticicia sp. CRIBPO]